MTTMYRVDLDCAHSGEWPVTADPFPGAVLHCGWCGKLSRSVFAKRTDPPADRRDGGAP